MLFADGPMSEPVSPGWTIGHWIVTILASLFAGGVFTWWLNRRKGNYLLVTRTNMASLVQIAESIRSHIKVTFRDTPVSQLSFINLSFENTAPEALKDIRV